jgi:hypothetical protein
MPEETMFWFDAARLRLLLCMHEKDADLLQDTMDIGTRLAKAGPRRIAPRRVMAGTRAHLFISCHYLVLNVFTNTLVKQFLYSST